MPGGSYHRDLITPRCFLINQFLPFTMIMSSIFKSISCANTSTMSPPTPETLEHGYPPRVIGDDDHRVLLQGLTYVVPKGARYLIETGSSDQPIARELRTVRLALAFGIPVFILVAVFGGLILVRNLLDPIGAITEQAERISSAANTSELQPVFWLIWVPAWLKENRRGV